MIPEIQCPALLQNAILNALISPAKSMLSILKRIPLSVCWLILAPALFSCPVAAEENLSADAIVIRAVDRAESQDRSLVEARYKSEAVSKTQSMDEDGRITGTETSRYIQYPLKGAVFEELVEKNGRPLNETEIEKEEARKQDFIREVEKRKIRGDFVQPAKEEKIRFNREFTERYQYKVDKAEVVRGYPCWAISFKPKEGKLPVRDRMDHVLNQLRGTLWIARDDFGLVCVEFALDKPFKYWGGFLAVVRKCDGRVDYQRVDSNVWLPLHFKLKLDLRVMIFKNIRKLLTKDWMNYSRAVRPSDSNRIAVDGAPSPPSGEGNP